MDNPTRPPRIFNAGTLAPKLCPNTVLVGFYALAGLTPGPKPPAADVHTGPPFQPHGQLSGAKFNNPLLLLL